MSTTTGDGRDPSPALMFITSLWEDGTVHLPRAPLGHTPDVVAHRARLRRRNRRRNLTEEGGVFGIMEFDTWPEGSPSHLAGIRTRIEFRPV